MVVYGTRPELIKLAPVIFELQRHLDRFDLTICATAQHRDMVDELQGLFGIRPDIDLDLMKENQSLNGLLARAIRALDKVFEDLEPDMILVQGDTTTVMAASLAAFHRNLRIGHVEAGLRTGDLASPFPEEANRCITDLVSDLMFAPTRRAQNTLIEEGRDPSRVFLTGNTVVDALNWISENLPDEGEHNEVLITVHRRESFGSGLRQIFEAIREVATIVPDSKFIYPVHRNPNVRNLAHEVLDGIENIILCHPLPYDQLIQHMKRSRVIVTDSGGIQEEAPSFGKPVLVVREKTERPEGVEAGVARLVGTDRQQIVDAVVKLLTDDAEYAKMSRASNPYGDGRAAVRIVEILMSGRSRLPVPT